MTTTAPARDDRASVDKAVAILKAFTDVSAGGIGVSEVARRAELSKSTAFRLLGMLERNGMVERIGSAYRLGRAAQALSMGPHARAHDTTRDLLTPYLVDLYEATRATVHLAVLDGTEVLYLNKLYSHQRVPSPSRIGGRAPAYCTSLGKVMLAFDRDAMQAQLIEPMRPFTPYTVTSPEVLHSQLQEIRRTGIATERNESHMGLACIAMPILGTDGRAVAAMSVSRDSVDFEPRALEESLRRICGEAARALAGYARMRQARLSVA